MKNLKTLSNTWYNIAHTQITISLAHLSTYHSHTYQHIAHTSITISLTHLSPYRSHTYYHIAHTPITISLTHLSTWQLPWASAHSCPPADKKASFQIGWCALNGVGLHGARSWQRRRLGILWSGQRWLP